MANPKKTPSYKVQAIVEGDKNWPYVGYVELNISDGMSGADIWA